MSLLEPLFDFFRDQFNETRGWPQSSPPAPSLAPIPIKMAPQTSMDQLLDPTTIYSLLGVLVLLFTAYYLSLRVLSAATPGRLRTVFIWNAFNCLIHAIFEGSFLYNVFFTSTAFNPATHHPSTITNFLNDSGRLYGSAYGDNWASKLWLVYSKADHRWAGADATIVSLELLTVFGAGPLSAWICYGITKRDWKVAPWLIVLATAELYGGMFHSRNFAIQDKANYFS